MATITTIRSQTRRRRFSLSLVSRPTPFLNLPAELVLDILELALSETKPSTLTTLSKVISYFVDIILYRTVVLHSKECITLFHHHSFPTTYILCVSRKEIGGQLQATKFNQLTARAAGYQCL